MISQLAINSNTYHGFSLEDAVKGAAQAGFNQIEISAVRDHTAHLLSDMTAEQRMHIKKLLHKYNMNCIGISAHSNLMDEEGIQNLIKSIDLAVEFDCNYIISATGDSHGDADVIEDSSILITHLQPILEKCQRLNKVLVLETHGNNFATGESLLSLIRSLEKNADRLRINYDTGNVIFYGNTEPYKDLAETANYVEFIHLKDKKGENNEWNFPAIGDGDLDFQRLFKILKESNFNGPVSVEIEFTPNGPKDLNEVNRSVKRSYQYLHHLLS